ncbi:MAG: alcohol dehydrogenase catalytic domain-containing protein [Nitrospirae bacterium]|nr:alcohol dehydrogenase catalytic domain-containing protein [Nitrospirota bacterium]
MKAVLFDGSLRLVSDYPRPLLKPDWAVIKVIKAGICRTDIELIKGYMGFKGILGHEFIGVIEDTIDKSLIGRRVTGEINVSCGKCAMCKMGLKRHCYNRAVQGIHKIDGAMAEYCTLPIENLKIIPDEISDEKAVFIEPMSAAAQILTQITIEANDTCVILGDGKLGILCAWVMTTVCRDVTIVGHHENKLNAARWNGLKTITDISEIKTGVDIVIEATGSLSGLTDAVKICRPMGIIILKSTVASKIEIDLSIVTINEISIIGSRCGLFDDGIGIMRNWKDMPIERLITARYPISEAVTAFEKAVQRDSLKVLLEF